MNTPQQQAVIDNCRTDDLAVSARAGTGKTTTIVAAANAIAPVPTIALAFNKAIAETLSKRMPPTVKSLTLNSLGHRSLMSFSSKRVVLNQDKLFDIEKELDLRFKHADMRRAISIVKAKCILPHDAPFAPNGPLNERVNEDWMESFIQDHDFEMGENAGRDVLAVLKASISRALGGEIDFDDQIYIPAIYSTPMPETEVLFVDEAQDLSPAQVSMLSKIKAKRRHIVGDPFQAIYGFRGAGYGAFEWTADYFSCRETPLTVSFRCPKSVITEAQHYVPDILAADSAIDGKVLRHRLWSHGAFADGDAVLCRYNKPLLVLAYRLIQRRIPCTIMGRDIGAGLKRFVKKANRDKLCDARDILRARFDPGAMRPTKAALYSERLEILDFFCEALGSSASLKQFEEFLDRIFSDAKAGHGVTLSSIHKAKGLEWGRVWFMSSRDSPGRTPRDENEAQQERNLRYVAITRAMRELHYMELEDME